MSREKRILIVEDEYLIALGTKSSLEDMGYRVEGIALSGKEAIDIAQASNPDMLLIDIRLRGKMDGIAAAQKIQEQHPIPVLFVSGNIDEDNLKRMESLKNWNCLTKPNDDTALKQAIELLLNKGQG